MRVAAVVVVTRPVSVVVRDIVVRVVGAGVTATVCADALVPEDEGCSGAALFCTCVAANAVIDASDVNVAAVASARRTMPERMSGERCAISDRTSRRPRGYMRLA